MIWSLFFCVVRLLLAVRFFTAFGSFVFGLSEVAAVAVTLVALRRGKVDRSIGGMLVPVVYCVPLLFSVANCTRVPGAVVLLMLLGVVQIVGRLYMGWRCTVGVPVFVKLLDSGPYSVIRHPLALVECVQCLLFSCAFISFHNCVVAVFAVLAIAFGAVLEESFLISAPGYSAYSQRVGWRLVPGFF